MRLNGYLIGFVIFLAQVAISKGFLGFVLLVLRVLVFPAHRYLHSPALLWFTSPPPRLSVCLLQAAEKAQGSEKYPTQPRLLNRNLIESEYLTH